MTEKEIQIIRACISLDMPTINAIANWVGLSRTNIVEYLSNLQKQNIIKKEGIKVIQSGRPSNIYKLNPDYGYFMGVSVKKDHITIYAADVTDEIILETSQPFTLNHKMEGELPEFINQIGEIIRKIIKERFDNTPPLCLGLTQPGMLDTDRGIWLQGLTMPGIHSFNIKAYFENFLKIPVFIEDEVRALTFFEKKRGNGISSEYLVLVYLGLGVSAGLYFNGALYRGFNGLSGEIGHIIYEKTGKLCKCGNTGCLETIISSDNIINSFIENIEKGVRTSLHQVYQNKKGIITLDDINKAADEEDKLTNSLLFEIGTILGDACSRIIKNYNPGLLLLSGPTSILGKHLIEPINFIIKQRVIPEMLKDFKILFTEYQTNQEAEGMYLLSKDYYWNKILTPDT